MATESIICGNCGEGVAATVVYNGEQVSRGASGVRWLHCPGCNGGSVKSPSGAVYPPAPAGATVQHLPPDVEGAWREARTAHAVAAYTAAEIMCRKILMHVAVDQAGSQQGETFAKYIDDLDGAHYFAPGLRPVVDKVRTRGNIANHELPASTEQDSVSTLKITQHLLQGIYELPGMAP